MNDEPLSDEERNLVLDALVRMAVMPATLNGKALNETLVNVIGKLSGTDTQLIARRAQPSRRERHHANATKEDHPNRGTRTGGGWPFFVPTDAVRGDDT